MRKRVIKIRGPKKRAIIKKKKKKEGKFLPEVLDL
jgi:hypothetical protein